MEKLPKKLLDQVRDVVQREHYSLSTEETYISWIKRYMLFHNKRHLREMGTTKIKPFPTHLAKLAGDRPYPYPVLSVA